MLPVTKVTVVFLSMALLGSGIYGAVHIKEDFNLQVLARDGSTFRQFVKMQEKYFLKGIPVNLILSDPVDYKTTSRSPRYWPCPVLLLLISCMKTPPYPGFTHLRHSRVR